jgi:ABC-type uncharacterized transport system permease subunit
MAELTSVTFYLGMVAYSAAATLFFVELARGDAIQLTRWAPRLFWLGLALHATHIVLSSLLTNICPVESLHFALSLSALMASGAYLVLRRRFRIEALGVAVAPLALTFMVGAEFVGTSGSAGSVSKTLLALHVAANLLGFGLFLLAGFAGAFYLFQERRLKTKRLPHLGGRLPALDSLDRAEHRLLLAGFPLLTFGVVSGAVFSTELSHMTSVDLVRMLLAYATWLLLALVLLLRAVAGWRGRRAAYGTLAGVGCVMVVVAIYVLQAGVGA